MKTYILKINHISAEFKPLDVAGIERIADEAGDTTFTIDRHKLCYHIRTSNRKVAGAVAAFCIEADVPLSFQLGY